MPLVFSTRSVAVLQARWGPDSPSVTLSPSGSDVRLEKKKRSQH